MASLDDREPPDAVRGLRIPDRFALLAHDAEGRNRLHPEDFDLGVAGATLGELALTGRLSVRDDGIVMVADPAPTGDPLLDAALDRVVAEQRLPVERWVERLSSRRASEELLRDLAERRVVVEHPRTVLGVFPASRRIAADPGAPGRLLDELAAQIDGRRAPTANGAVLIALAEATGLLGRLLGPSEPGAVGRVLSGGWVAGGSGDALGVLTTELLAVIGTLSVAASSARPAPPA